MDIGHFFSVNEFTNLVKTMSSSEKIVNDPRFGQVQQGFLFSSLFFF